jgi:hypothetical protein
MSNIYKIRISGVTEIDGEIDIKDDWGLVLKRCAVKNVTKKLTNENDDAIYTYTLESLDIATLISEGKTINGKAKSISKSMRGAIFYLAEENGIENTEKFYEEFGKKIIVNIKDIYDKLYN